MVYSLGNTLDQLRGPAILTLTQSERTDISNWLLGGCLMGTVRTELAYARKKHAIFGSPI